MIKCIVISIIIKLVMFTLTLWASKHHALCNRWITIQVLSYMNIHVIDSYSYQQGWRLLIMFCSFFDCDDILRPYVLAYIEEVARDQIKPECSWYYFFIVQTNFLLSVLLRWNLYDIMDFNNYFIKRVARKFINSN